MKFNVYIDDVLLQKPDGSGDITPKDVPAFNLRAAEEMIVEDDMDMIERTGIKASIYLACETRHFHDLSNRNIRIEKAEKTK